MNTFAPHTGIDWQPNGIGQARYGDDKNLLVMFYNKPVVNIAKSQAAGRPISENKIFVKIQHPGESFNIIDREKNDSDVQRFREHWSKFLLNRSQIPEGTPIDLLFPNNPAFAENLRAMGVYTIEQCVALSAHAIDAIGRGGQEVVNRAKAYIDSATSGKAFHGLQKKYDDLAQQFRILEQQNSQLRDQLNTFMMRSQPQQNNPGYVPGFDAQSQRINANHVTQELAHQRALTPVKQVVDTSGFDAVPSENSIPQDMADQLLSGM